MQRLIGKFSHIQKAFHTIQVKTVHFRLFQSINDPTLIADKFFSYEELTENLMKSISNYEKILEEKTKRNEELKQELKRI